MVITLIVIVLAFLLLRIPSLILQPVFCDEAIYIHWGQLIVKNFHQNLFIPLTDGKTPLFMWLSGISSLIFSDALFAGRLISVTCGLITLLGMYLLGRKFFNNRTGVIAACFIVVAPFTVFFDKLALVDSMLAMFSIWSLYFALSLVEKVSFKNITLLGLTLGLGLLAKTPGIFSFVTLPFVLITFNFAKKEIKKVFKVIGGMLISAGIGYVIFNILRISPDFIHLSSRDQDYFFPFTRLLVTPLNPLISHFRDLTDWFPKFLTWPILVLIFLSFVFIVSKKNLKALFILIWAAFPILAMSLLLKTFTARYMLFGVEALIFLAAFALDNLYGIFPFGKKIWPLVAIILIVLIPAARFDYYLSTNPLLADLPREERRGYFEDWTAGYGTKEISTYLLAEAMNHKIVVVTEGAFGTLPDGLEIYFKDNPNIDVWYSSSILDPEVYTISAYEPTYFVVNKSHQAFNRNLKLINEYKKAKGPGVPQDSLILYKVEP